MSSYVEFLLLGLGNGGVFAALAVALVVTYRSSGVLNFATGAQALYAAYTYSLLRNGQLLQPIPGLSPTISVGSSLGFWPALLITLAIQAVLGALCYLLVFRPLRNHRPVTKAVASIGLMGLLTAVVQYQVGTQVINVNPIFPQNHVSFLGVDHLHGPALAGRDDHRPRDRADRPLPLHPVRPGHPGVGRDRGGRAGQRALAGPHRADQLDHQLRRLRHRRRPDRPLVPAGAGHLHPVHRAGAGRGRGRPLPLAWAGPSRPASPSAALESLSVYLNGVHPVVPRRRGRADPPRAGPGRAGLPGPHHAEPGHAPPGDARPGPASALAHPDDRGRRSRWAWLAIYLFTGNNRAALYTSFIMAVITLSLVVVTGYTGQISLAQLTFAGVSAYILSTFATSGASRSRSRPCSPRSWPPGRRGDRPPGLAGPRPDARRRHIDVRRRRRGHLVQQQLARRRRKRAGHPAAAPVRHQPRHRLRQ